MGVVAKEDAAPMQCDGIEPDLAATYDLGSKYLTSYFSHHRRRFIEEANYMNDLDTPYVGE